MTLRTEPKDFTTHYHHRHNPFKQFAGNALSAVSATAMLTDPITNTMGDDMTRNSDIGFDPAMFQNNYKIFPNTAA